MAVAVKNTTESRAGSPPTQLLLASMAGAAFVLAAVGVVFYGLPYLWSLTISPALASVLGTGSFLEIGAKLVVLAAAAIALFVAGNTIAGTSPPTGIRAGITLVISVVFTAFFIANAIGRGLEARLVTDPGQAGLGLAITVGIGLAVLAGGLFLLGRNWAYNGMLALEQQGWFEPSGYKKNQGQRVRRLTMLGILIVAGSGVYTLMQQRYLETINPDWFVVIPFTGGRGLTLLPDLRFTVPLLLGALVLWLAYRVVNLPTFADFLIATEAEMNKVSWSTRRQLIRDTIVVLVTTALMTVFLLFVDLAWGWLLSRDYVAIVPKPKTDATKTAKANQEQDW